MTTVCIQTKHKVQGPIWINGLFQSEYSQNVIKTSLQIQFRGGMITNTECDLFVLQFSFVKGCIMHFYTYSIEQYYTHSGGRSGAQDQRKHILSVWAAVPWCSMACWDIFADWLQPKHSWPVFTELSVLKAYLRWKAQSGGWKKEKCAEKKRRGQGQEKNFRNGNVQRALRSVLICLLLFDPRDDFLSFSLPVPLFHSQETERCMYTKPLITGSTFSLPLWASKVLFFFCRLPVYKKHSVLNSAVSFPLHRIWISWAAQLIVPINDEDRSVW